jgi:ABC-2 type transport system permease protein
MPGYVRTIVWAQWKSFVRITGRHASGAILFFIVSAVWYGAWTLASIAVAALLAEVRTPDRLPAIMTVGLLVVFLYCQVVPLILATTGAALDLKRLLVYPVPRGQLFAIEVVLRITISAEMLVLLAGAAVGLWRNPLAPRWAPLALLPFILLNLFLSAGLRDLLTRLLARKRVREAVVFLIVMLAALPQFLAMQGDPQRVRKVVSLRPSILLPWAAAGRLAGGQPSLPAALVLLGWTVAAFGFGRWQFNKGLRFDIEAAQASDRPAARTGSFADRLFRIPSRLLRDPIGAMVEKDLRFLARAPRFRLVFLMGFTFGLVIWLPFVFSRRRGPDFLAENLLTLVSVYALMLLGESLIWNFFGFDRSAAQFYHLAPVPFSKVLVAKNITAAALIVMEISLVTLACLLIRIPVSGFKIAEAFSVTLVLLLYLISLGNVSSTSHPRAVDPAQSWRSSARGFQMLLILVYPVAAAPLALPYLARYAFESETAFFLVLAFDAVLGAILYWVGMDSAMNSARQRKERMIAALTRSEGPIA